MSKESTKEFYDKYWHAMENLMKEAIDEAMLEPEKLTAMVALTYGLSDSSYKLHIDLSHMCCDTPLKNPSDQMISTLGERNDR